MCWRAYSSLSCRKLFSSRPLLRVSSLVFASVLMYAVSARAQPTSPQPNYDTVLVCAPDLMDAATHWTAYRSKQGHQVAVVRGGGSKEEIRATIKKLAAHHELKSVVLMGDAPSGERRLGTHVAAHRAESVVIRKWGAEPTYTTDNYYADLDEDGSPELALGRITADSPAQLAGTIAKIIAYEQNPNVGTWRRRVNFIAGVGGFGLLADKILETAAKKFITDGIPSDFRTSMTQASWRSPYSPHPGMFQAQTIERMNQGCLAWIYLGHGQKRGLDYYRVPDGGLPIFSTREIPRVDVREGSPIAVFLSCYAGAFDSEPDCLAEELLAKPSGPVAVIAGSNVTMPYAMTVMGNAMLHELFDEQRETLGEVVLRAKQKLAEPTEKNTKKGIIDQLAMVISPDPDLLDEERTEHVRLFHLLGDPLLRIRYPKKVTVDVAEYGTSGETIEVSGTSELDGPCVVELVCRRDRITFKRPARSKFQMDKAWLNGLQETYAKANNTVWTAKQTVIRDGKFELNFDVPENATGPSHVRVYVQSKHDFAMGSSDIYLRLPPKEEQTEELVEELSPAATPLEARAIEQAVPQ